LWSVNSRAILTLPWASGRIDGDLEHCRRPWRSVIEKARTCEGVGRVSIPARGYDERGCWEPHGFLVDAYRCPELSMPTLVEITLDPDGPDRFLHAVEP
jgi:hypothetical protein